MKRQLHSSSPPTSPLSSSQISDEFEPVPKRPRFFVSSPTPPPDNNDIEIEEENDVDDDEEEIIIDDPIVPSVTITEDSQSEHDSDDDIIEIEQQYLDLIIQPTDNAIIVVSDSESDGDNDDDQGIDVTDDIVPSVSSIINVSIPSPDIEDVEIVHEFEEELSVLDQEEEQMNTEDDHESLEIVTNDDNNNNNSDELIDLTEDEPILLSYSTISSERKLSTDVQQCPICLETLSHLQRTGVYLIITRCRHVMCTLCSRQLLATSSRCPLCRENVSSTTLMPYCILT